MKICIDEHTYEGSADLDCPLPDSGVEGQALAMFAHLAKAGALVILEE